MPSFSCDCYYYTPTITGLRHTFLLNICCQVLRPSSCLRGGRIAGAARQSCRSATWDPRRPRSRAGGSFAAGSSSPCATKTRQRCCPHPPACTSGAGGCGPTRRKFEVGLLFGISGKLKLHRSEGNAAHLPTPSHDPKSPDKNPS